MRKILSAEQIRLADDYTIRQEPISSIDLMERTSIAFVEKFIQLFSPQRTIAVICGPGNNGGDGFAIARLLLARSYDVTCYEINDGALSQDCAINKNKYLEIGGKINLVKESLDCFREEVVIDAIFGSGLSRPIQEGVYSNLIEVINKSSSQVVSVDMPSGLFADRLDHMQVIQADHTITFALPKLSFLLPESGGFVGKFHVLDIGLDREFLNNAPSDYYLIDDSAVAPLLKRREKFSHKGNYGRVQLVAGSLGKTGAAYLAGKACLRMGAGLLTINIPKSGNLVIQTNLPEAMTLLDTNENHISNIEVQERTKVFCLGPGLGKAEETRKALARFLKDVKRPIVLDADALNILSENTSLLNHLPKGSVITPHAVEFERLFGRNENSIQNIELMRSFSKKSGVIIVSKGAHTVVTDEGGKVFFNTSGNPGMATAGSGDVLAGMITGLMSQGMNGRDAAIVGVYLHGSAGDIAKNELGEMSLMASDLLDAIPEAISNASNKDFI